MILTEVRVRRGHAPRVGVSSCPHSLLSPTLKEEAPGQSPCGKAWGSWAGVTEEQSSPLTWSKCLARYPAEGTLALRQVGDLVP